MYSSTLHLSEFAIEKSLCLTNSLVGHREHDQCVSYGIVGITNCVGQVAKNFPETERPVASVTGKKGCLDQPPGRNINFFF